MYGLSKVSSVKKIVVKVSKDFAIEYRVVTRKIDLNKLTKEKERLEAELAESEPTNKELVEYAKQEHPFYFQDLTQDRIDEIDDILNL